MARRHVLACFALGCISATAQLGTEWGQWSGQFETIVEDLRDGSSRTRYYLSTAEGPLELYIVRGAGLNPRRASALPNVTIRGLKAGSLIAADLADVVVEPLAAPGCSPIGGHAGLHVQLPLLIRD